MSLNNHKRSVVLVDMDHVLTDLEAYTLNKFRQRYPDEPFIPLNERRMLNIFQEYNQLKLDLGKKVLEMANSKGFFENLPVMEGATDALKEIHKMENVDVYICTTPIPTVDDTYHCHTEKFRWVEKHLGADWVNRVIMTRDKTMIHGDILIDDKPDITGVIANPMWEHILFSAHHNLHIDAKQTRLANWTDGTWRQIIEDRLKKLSLISGLA